jgi:hypothetical protein
LTRFGLTRFALMVALTCGPSILVAYATGDSDVFDGLSPGLVGAELTTVLEGAELACRQDPKEMALRRCKPLPGALDSLGGVPVTAVEALFKDEQLVQVTVYFPESRFADVKHSLSPRFGDGTDWSVSLRAGMAGTVKDEVLLWEKEDLVMIAQQFDGKIDRSSLVYGSAEVMARLLKHIKSTPPGATRDL